MQGSVPSKLSAIEIATQINHLQAMNFTSGRREKSIHESRQYYPSTTSQLNSV